MKKYWSLYTNHLAASFEYRSEIFFTVIYELIGIVGIAIFWTSVYTEGQQIGGLGIGAMLSYYLIIPLVVLMVDVNISENIGKDIQQGILANYLLKPFRSQMYYITKVLAGKTINLITLVPIYLIPFLLLSALGIFIPTWGSILMGLTILLFSMVMYLGMDFVFGYSSFWLEDVWAFRHIKIIIVGVLGGLYFPLSLVQDPLLAKVIGFLPFKYIYYTPISYFLGKYGRNEIGNDLIIMAIWGISFALFAFFLWKKGLKKYEAYGR